MRDAGVLSGGCSRMPFSPWVRLCRERSREEISGKRHCGVCCFAECALALLLAHGWLEVHGAIFPEKGKEVENLQRVWPASACA